MAGVGENVEKLEPSYPAGGDGKGAAAVQHSLAVPQHVSGELACGPAVPLLASYSRELRTGTQAKTHAYRLLIVGSWREPECPRTWAHDVWVRKTRYIPATRFSPATGGSETLTVETRVNLENILRSEKARHERPHGC